MRMFFTRMAPVTAAILVLLSSNARSDFNSLLSQATAHWPLQDNAANTTVVDATGSNSGTLQGGDSSQDLSESGPNSWYPKALRLDGMADYITLSSAVTADASSAGTIAAWINANTLNTMSLSGDSASDNDNWFLNGGDGRYRDASGTTTFFNTENMSATTWYSVILTRETDNTWRWYTNGVQNSGDKTIDNRIYANQIAARHTGEATFDGSIAGVAFFPQAFDAMDATEWFEGPEPVNIDLPVATHDGTPEVGETVSVSTGVWDLPAPFSGLSNGGVSYSYQWERDTGSGFSPISAETNSTYTLTGTDEGNKVRCEVTARNAGGDGDAAVSNIIVVAAPAVGIAYDVERSFGLVPNDGSEAASNSTKLNDRLDDGMSHRYPYFFPRGLWRFEDTIQTPTNVGRKFVGLGLGRVSGALDPSPELVIDADDLNVSVKTVVFDGSAITAETDGASDVIEISGYTVVDNDFGRTLEITDTMGTNFTAGTYEVIDVDTGTNEWTLDSNVSTNTTSGMKGKAYKNSNINFNGTTITATSPGNDDFIYISGYTAVIDDIGRSLEITDGTGFIEGWYVVTDVNAGANAWRLDRDVSTTSASAMQGTAYKSVWEDRGFGNVYDGLVYRGNASNNHLATPKGGIGWHQLANPGNTINRGKATLRNCTFHALQVGMLFGRGMSRAYDAEPFAGGAEGAYAGAKDNHGDHVLAENLNFSRVGTAVYIRNAQSVIHHFKKLRFVNLTDEAFYVERGGQLYVDGIESDGTPGGLLRIGHLSPNNGHFVIRNVSYDSNTSPNEVKMLRMDHRNQFRGLVEFRGVYIDQGVDYEESKPIFDVKGGTKLIIDGHNRLDDEAIVARADSDSSPTWFPTIVVTNSILTVTNQTDVIDADTEDGSTFYFSGNTDLQGTKVFPPEIFVVGSDELGLVSAQVTLATGRSSYKLHPESGTSDDLTTIIGGVAGQLYYFRTADASDTIVLKDGTDNLNLNGDRTLDGTGDQITLFYDGMTFYEQSFSDND